MWKQIINLYYNKKQYFNKGNKSRDKDECEKIYKETKASETTDS